MKKLTGRSKRNYEQLCDRVKKATKELLPAHFPVTPKGFLTRKRKAPLEIDDSEREDLRKLEWDWVRPIEQISRLDGVCE